MDDVNQQFVNIYIQKLVKEVEENTKNRLLFEARMQFVEDANKALNERLQELEQEQEKSELVSETEAAEYNNTIVKLNDHISNLEREKQSLLNRVECIFKDMNIVIEERNHIRQELETARKHLDQTQNKLGQAEQYHIELQRQIDTEVGYGQKHEYEIADLKRALADCQEELAKVPLQPKINNKPTKKAPIRKKDAGVF
jgi:chromosome segregation ATPase